MILPQYPGGVHPPTTSGTSARLAPDPASNTSTIWRSPLPFLPIEVAKAIDTGRWTPELSSAADRAIAQTDTRYELEFTGVTL